MSELKYDEWLILSKVVQFNCDSNTTINMYDVYVYQNGLWG